MGRGRLGGGMSAEQRQEVAASAGGAVEQAVLTSLSIIEQQSRAQAGRASMEQIPAGEVLPSNT